LLVDTDFVTFAPGHGKSRSLEKNITKEWHFAGGHHIH
jgi:hypothetical protein